VKLLVLVRDYPRLDGSIPLMYVHTRNQYYIQNNIDVTVLNFSANQKYVYDGIPVITLKDYVENKGETYDILVCHAPNIRNHYQFLKKHEKEFPKIVFFFHGHEVVRINKIYPKPFRYYKKSRLRRIMQDLYDTVKLKLWHDYFPTIAYKSFFVFVSEWMFNEFFKWTKIKKELLSDKYAIIHNGVGKVFEIKSYDLKCNKERLKN
jgi:hypothetical protein